ncbi:VanZ family protein [Marisediminicola sp. LYQ85]|uniref:VanZ family protein n=1 Tax=Marisediminicola sp. LYQ85 TaxID=3391062 RepID=UPI0039834E9F
MKAHKTDVALQARTKTVVIALGVLYVGAVLWVTLQPVPFATEGAEPRLSILTPEAWTSASSWTAGRPLEVALNVLMFIPVGVATGLLCRGSARLTLPLALTLAIELAQIPLDRISHPRDLLANAIGGLLGVALASRSRPWRQERKQTTPRATLEFGKQSPD